VFANPDSFRLHKRKDGYCRSEEALVAVGYRPTANGWLHTKALREKR
jgi:hypothetical protein